METGEKKIGMFSIGQWLLVGLLVVSAFFIGSLYTKVQYLEKVANTGANPDAQQPEAPKVDLATIKGVFDKNVIKFGDANRKLLFVEVADPSCPYCSVAAGQNPELNKQVGEQFVLTKDGGSYIAPVPEMRKLVEQGVASFAYIYFPGHGNGEMGTKAIYCAAREGKFWEAHDLIMTAEGYDLVNTQVKNDKTKSAQVAQFFKSVLDPVKLKTCIDDKAGDTHLSEDITLARSLGVTGTPGFFVNDTRFAGAYSYKDIEPTVIEALK